MPRRRVIVLLGAALTFALVAVACGDDLPAWDPVPPADLGTAPEPFDAASLETATPIKHVVFLIKENRTFDNMFGRFPGADGVTVGMDEGEPRPFTPGPDRLEQDIKHCYECALQAWNDGAMDGFATISEAADGYAYTQLQPDDLPNYWRWAERFVLGDNFFASAQGPSFPNHLYTIAAQSGGTHTIVTSAQNNEEALNLLKLMGLPFAEGRQPEVKREKPVEQYKAFAAGKEVPSVLHYTSGTPDSPRGRSTSTARSSAST